MVFNLLLKCSPTLIVLFCTVTSVYLYEDKSAKFRSKREEARWIWGFDDSTEPSKPNPTQSSTIPPLTAVKNSTPCDPYNSPRPNFNADGRRISKSKCYEYAWEIKFREERDKKSRECTISKLKKNRGPFEPHFAIGGHDTLPGEYPHMGAIGWKATVGTWIFKCGSSLISNKFVLTAAHCSAASIRDTSIADPVPKIVRLGDKNIIDVFANGIAPKDVNITRIIVHPQFSSPKKYYDIALMELDQEVVFTKYIQPACLWADGDTSKLGREATLTGWGVVESGGRTSSPELQAATVDVLDSQECDQLLRPSCYRNWCGMQDHQLCAGKLAGGVDACQGDSGGPLQVKIPLPITTQGSMHYVIGVTSFGIGCALPGLPGIYTRVSSFIDWIEDNVWR